MQWIHLLTLGQRGPLMVYILTDIAEVHISKHLKKSLGKWETKHPKNMGERDEDGTGHTNPLPPASHIATVGVLAALLWIQLPAKVWKMASPWNPAPTLKTSRKLPALDWLNSDHCSYWWVNHQEKKISFSPSLCVSPFQIKINLFYFNGQW